MPKSHISEQKRLPTCFSGPFLLDNKTVFRGAAPLNPATFLEEKWEKTYENAINMTFSAGFSRDESLACPRGYEWWRGGKVSTV